MSNKYLSHLKEEKELLLKAIKHLDYSYQKLATLDKKLDLEDDELLETWESFSARFSRVMDIFLARYLRSFVLYHDPGFKGSLRDFIHFGEKMGLYADGNKWLALRELRNITAHENNETDIKAFYHRLYDESQHLLTLTDMLALKTPCE